MPAAEAIVASAVIREDGRCGKTSLHVAIYEAVSVKQLRVSCFSVAFKRRQTKRVQIPSVGSGLDRLRSSSFNVAGVGSCCLVTDNTGIDSPGDRFKRPAVKSSTMKGPINYERKGLPVRFRGDGAESRKAVQERYPELLLS